MHNHHDKLKLSSGFKLEKSASKVCLVLRLLLSDQIQKHSATHEQYFSPTKLGISKVLRAVLELSLIHI